VAFIQYEEVWGRVRGLNRMKRSFPTLRLTSSLYILCSFSWYIVRGWKIRRSSIVLFKGSFKDPRYCSLVLFKCTQKTELPEGFGPCTGDSKVIGMFMNECIDSTMGRNPRILAVLLASDDPRTSWSFQRVHSVFPENI
jgi:hypothetical protein